MTPMRPMAHRMGTSRSWGRRSASSRPRPSPWSRRPGSIWSGRSTPMPIMGGCRSRSPRSISRLRSLHYRRHALESLLEYPLALIFFYLLYRVLTSRIPRLRSWYDRARQRFGRLFLLIVNVVIVSPLVIAAIEAGINAGISSTSSVLSEVTGLMGSLGSLLLFYVIWLSFGPRQVIIAQIRQRKLIPIVLLSALYLLDALIATANGAAVAA